MNVACKLLLAGIVNLRSSRVGGAMSDVQHVTDFARADFFARASSGIFRCACIVRRNCYPRMGRGSRVSRSTATYVTSASVSLTLT